MSALLQKRLLIKEIIMGLFDSIKNSIQSEVKQSVNSSARRTVNDIGNGAKQMIQNSVKSKTETFTFASLPTNVSELQALPECSLDTPFKTVALAIAALCNFANNENETFAMLDFLKGPENTSTYEKQFIKERLANKTYKTFAFFEGANTQNGYKPSVPYTIKVSDSPYSYSEENWATLYVKSAGADSPGLVKLRRKPSTGQWFINDIQCLSDIRIPASEDPWA